MALAAVALTYRDQRRMGVSCWRGVPLSTLHVVRVRCHPGGAARRPGPLAVAPRLGGWLVAVSMAGALVFGLINHFIISGSDHVSHVAADWRLLFGVTAVLLVVCEAVGTAVGVWAAD
jgi:hypothetical protein